MPPQHLPCFSLSILVLLLLHTTATDENELSALLALKSALHHSNPTLFSSWLPTNPPCSFPGISCDDSGNVTGIDLSNKGLSGTLPFQSICSLPSLNKLAFGFNYLSGDIKDDLSNCTHLQYLDLGNNQFSGPFPDISSMTGLKYLYMNLSGITGVFPWKSLSSISGLTQLSVGDNSLDKTPFPKEVTQLTSLNWLYMSNCTISGSIPPDIGNLTQLINLELADNSLSGSIPQEISKLNKLWQLELYDNNLTGKLPLGFGNLSNLQRFDASHNNLEGDLSELRSLNKLVWLQLFENNFSGEIPAEFGEFKTLVNLSLYTNKLTGQLPQQLGSWAEFNFIDVSTNFISGPIPPHMCKRGTMKKLLILQNNFSGEIPATYANCTTLTRFRVSENKLTGEIPAGIWGLPNLNIIDIEHNELHGSVSPHISTAKNLGQIFAGSNKLSGNLPAEIGGASSLVSVDFSDNQLAGEIPESISELKILNSLNLENNRFSGNIPASLGECPHLSDINLAYNSFSGRIPLSLGSLPVLNSLNLSRNELSGPIPNTLSSSTLSILDLSYNELSGPIPNSLIMDAYNGSFAGNNGLCSSHINHLTPCSSRSREYHTFVICLVVGLVVIVLLSGYYVYLKLMAARKENDDRSLSLKDDYSWDMKSYHVVTFSEEQILDSIKPENLIGKGGSGTVYKVSLKDGKELAVKHIWTFDPVGVRKRSKSSTPMLDKQGGGRSRKSKEFDMEVETLSSIRHINVVKLYCSITSEDSSLLVYEYLPNGSLWDRLHTNKKLGLDWQSRYEIALGSSRGLEYLHHGYERPVIHRDVKSSNILLDEFLKPRIADFGLAKIVQPHLGHDSTHVIAGTHGYIAPEYGYAYKVDEKSDVYSFGVVLMELVTGKRPIDPEFGENKDIVSWVSSKLKNQESVLSTIDSSIGKPMREEAIKVLKIAVLCTARLPEFRPTMRRVVQMLEEAEPCKLVSIILTKDGAKMLEQGK